MNLIRNERQAALNDLLVAVEKSSDHYRDAVNYLKSSYPSNELRQIARQRDQMALRIEQAIRQADDLPSAPDEDRETFEKLLHRMHASISEDEILDLLQQRLAAEQDFLAMIDQSRQGDWAEQERGMLDELERQARDTAVRVSQLIDDLSSSSADK